METGRTLWFTGLSGAGKSTISRAVAERLRASGRRVEVLDGDVVREHLCSDLGFTREDRDENIRRIAFVADLLSRNGVWVCVAAISPYREAREQARQVIGDRFVEIWVRAPVDVCEGRDPKGLYERARRGEIDHFTGVSDPYEEPLAAEVVLETASQSPEESIAEVLAFVGAVETVGTSGSPNP